MNFENICTSISAFTIDSETRLTEGLSMAQLRADLIKLRLKAGI